MADEKNSKPENIRRAIVISCIIPFTTKTMRVSNPYASPIWYTAVIDAVSLYSLFSLEILMQL